MYFTPVQKDHENYDKIRFKIALKSVNCLVIGNKFSCNIFNLALKQGINFNLSFPDQMPSVTKWTKA